MLAAIVPDAKLSGRKLNLRARPNKEEDVRVFVAIAKGGASWDLCAHFGLPCSCLEDLETFGGCHDKVAIIVDEL